MQSLCTHLPDLPPAGEEDSYRFKNATRFSWCYDCDLSNMHAAFHAQGMPYTVQFRPAIEQFHCDDRSWEHSCLTAAERNPSLCRQ